MRDGPIVVLAAAGDAEARGLPARLPHLDVRVMTPADLSCAGWELRPGQGDGVVVAGGLPVREREVAAVLVRLPWVTEHEVPWVEPGDRAYVAAEMSAVLLAWLEALPCPLANRPTTTCLAGPLWRRERWASSAASVGLGVMPVRRSTGPAPPAESPAPGRDALRATVVGDRCVGVIDAGLVARLRALARVAGADVLDVWLSGRDAGARLLAAGPVPSLAGDAVLGALLAHLGVAPGARGPAGAR